MVDPRINLEPVRGLGFLQLVCSGTLDATSAARVRDELTAMLRKYGRLVADVAGLAAADECVGVFRQAYEVAGGWPTVRLVLCRPTPELTAGLRRTGLTPFLCTAADLARAVPLLDSRPNRVAHAADLPTDPTGTGAARSFATRCGYDWGLPEAVRLKAALLLTELTIAAVQRSAVRLRAYVELRERALHVALREWSTGGAPPELTRVALATLADRWTAADRPDGALVTADLYI